MLSLPLLTLFLLRSYTDAAVFTAPVELNVEAFSQLFARAENYHLTSFEEALEIRKLRRRGQSVLTSDESSPSHERHRVEIWDAEIFSPFVVPAAIGNPPQPFRLLLDLTWDTLFVPSADCSGDCESWAGLRLRFYSNHSSTYSVLESQAVVLYGTDAFRGDLALDTFRIAGLEVDSQRFVNADQAEPLGFISFYHGYDGVLGLAPRFYELGKYDFRKALSPWFNMVNDSLLDSNLFALELPTGVQHWQDINRWGEISFGGISEKYVSSNFSRLPLNQFSDQVWAVEAPSLTWENATHPLHEDFVNVTLAGFDTTAWFIGLPGDWPKRIYASVDHSCGFLLCTIDCMARDKMPNLTFGLAGGNFTITPYDYTNEVEVPGKERICFFNIYPTKGNYPTDAIVLGKPFMEAFYSVFDLDNMEIRLTKRIN